MLSRDPACRGYSVPLLYFKGFHALQSYRVAHYYWTHERPALALYLQSRISEAFAVDIHPGARIGKGIMFDHATSVVIGETAVIEDDFSMLHEVTLGGTGKVGGDRHPKIGKGVMIGAGAKVLGNIRVGEGAESARDRWCWRTWLPTPPWPASRHDRSTTRGTPCPPSTTWTSSEILRGLTPAKLLTKSLRWAQDTSTLNLKP